MSSAPLQLVSELAQLQAQAPVPDFHPGSDGKVLDIIHPSMCASPDLPSLSRRPPVTLTAISHPTDPYVAGETRLVSGSGLEQNVFRTQTDLQLYSEYGDVPDPVPHLRCVSSEAGIRAHAEPDH